MAFLVHPQGGIPPLPSPPADHALYLSQLIDWRSQQLDAFWQQLATQLQLSADERVRAQRSMQKLVGIGMLAIEENIAPVDRLRQLTTVELFIDEPMPPLVQTISGSGASAPRLWHLDNIHVKSGFDGTGVTVGVIDSGYDPGFPDLQGSFTPLFAQYTPAPSASTALGTMVVKTTASDLSPDKHGSKVCVMLAGKTAGVAPQARVLVASLPAQSFSATKHQMALAINWLLIQPTGAHPDRPYGCDVITTSLHSAGPKKAAGPAIEVALAAAETFNTLVVAAIGNGGAGQWQPPGSEPNVIGVGAVDEQGQVLISAYGTVAPSVHKPDLVAPGDNVQIPDGTGGATFVSGSSYAAPIAAGAVAIILQQHPQLRPSVGKLRSTLLTFTSPPPTQAMTTASGHGIVDLNGL